ncbi:FadR/GntR family transcriptional regulator [Bordetella petrii]|uniref:FadR/GntR family transcriptional regulator n=1 Tax=Bordetella petrii TaxID=94624 RepID=UPI001E36A597|nr:FadR/GntR family transcriptional regulator [Bordetella petrii]MCD0502242.1 FadR family transcriptional regulator [Bordetella petrii]
MQETNQHDERTLSDRLTDILAQEIRGGVYPVNSRLPTEKFMTEQYGVSRTVVREVISRLKAAKLVETRQGSGTVVLDPSSSDAFRLGRPDADPARGVLRIIELRRGLEGEMAALAAERRTGQHMLRINRALAAIDIAVDMDGDGVEEDLAFHIAIAHATGNPHYPELLGMLTRALKDAIRVTRGNEARQAQLADDVRNEHEAIRAAIERQDVDAARAAAVHHMLSTARRIQNVDPEYWQGANRAAAGRLARTRLAADLREKK